MPPTAPSAPRVLVIDDDRDFCELMQDALSDAGYEVVTRTSVGHDLGSITRLHVDALIVDLLLGSKRVSGWDLIRRLKADPWLVDLPILAISADLPSIRAHAAEVASMPGIRVLEKPFRLESLLTQLHDLIEAAAARPFLVMWSDEEDFSVEFS